jgi:hypothetical protein
VGLCGDFEPVKRPIISLIAISIIAIAVGACGKKKAVGELPATSARAFDNATPEIKDLWIQALEADKTNDYYRAEVLLFEILRQKPAEEQMAAAKDEMTLVHQRMKDGLAKGDPAAKAAFEQYQAVPPSRAAAGQQ